MDEAWNNMTAFDELPFDDIDNEESVLDDPRKIYEYLRSKVYKQDKACKAAAMILYNHIHNKITSRNFFCGPAGSGKTYVWQIIKELFPYVILVDSSTMTKMGFSGSNKINSFLFQIDPNVKEGYIIVYDEFDKLCKPQYSHDENISACIQSELLALIQPSTDRVRLKESRDTERVVRVDNISYVFCGSFAEAAENEARKQYCSGLGFGAVKKEPKAFAQELTMQNLIDFGVIPEVASRATRLVNLRPLTEEDYNYLLTKHPNSPVNRLESAYGLQEGFIRNKIIKTKDLQEIALNAYESGLGVRSTTAAIQRRVDDYIFEHFQDMKQAHTL